MSDLFIKNVRESVKYWYIPLVTGLILVGTGLWTFSAPVASFVALSIVFSLSFLMSGILEIIFAISNRNEIDNWGWSLVLGIMTALVGVVLLSHPEISMVSLPLYVGFMVLFRSFSAIGVAMDLKSYGETAWKKLMFIGVLGAMLSFILIWDPLFAGMTIVFWTGMAFLVNGGFNLYVAFKMRTLHKNG